MTSLIWILDSEGVCLAMDTLSVRATDGRPHKFCSKMYPLPHLAMVICGTGSPRLALEWFSEVQVSVVARDMDYLDEVAATRLRQIANRLDEPTVSTVYHFGYSPREGGFTGRAFRTRNDFAMERIGPSIGVKPGHEEVALVAERTLDELGYVDGVVELTRRLRLVDDALPLSERVGIGGEIHFLLVNGQGMFKQVVHRWQDCDEQFRAMLDQLTQDAVGLSSST